MRSETIEQPQKEASASEIIARPDISDLFNRLSALTTVGSNMEGIGSVPLVDWADICQTPPDPSKWNKQYFK